MTTPRRHPFPRVLAVVAAAVALALAPALPAQAAPVVTEVPGGEYVYSLGEYDGLLYLGSESGLQSYDGTTFTTIPGAPESPRHFVEYLGDLWMVGGPLTGPERSLWRFDGTTIVQVEALAFDPVVIDGLLYFALGDSGTGLWTMASHDGTATTSYGGPDIGELAAGPNGEIVFTASTPVSLWVFDGISTFSEVIDPGAPEDVYGLELVGGVLAFGARETPGDDATAYTWSGSAFTKLGATGGGAADPDCFLVDGGVLYYSANDGVRGMFSATPGVAASEAAVSGVPNGCPRYVATDGTFYLQAQGTGGEPTLHTWDGTTLTELDSVGDFPTNFVEYGGKLYFSAQPVSETPGLFVLEDVTTPTGPTLPPTGAEVSPLLIALAALLVLGGAAALVIARRRRV